MNRTAYKLLWQALQAVRIQIYQAIPAMTAEQRAMLATDLEQALARLRAAENDSSAQSTPDDGAENNQGDTMNYQQQAAQAYRDRFWDVVFSDGTGPIDFKTTAVKTRAASDDDGSVIEVTAVGDEWEDLEPDVYEIWEGDLCTTDLQWDEVIDMEWSDWYIWAPGTY